MGYKAYLTSPWGRYAAQQGYDLLYYHVIDHAYESDDIKNSDACMHPTEGWRGSPWCKLPAILHALTTGGERGGDRFL
jgi:hypothetical protein